MEEIDSFMDNNTNRQIAARFGVCEVTVSRWRKKVGRTLKGYGPNRVKSLEEIRQLYATDLYTQKQLAEMFGVSRQTINYIVNFKGRYHGSDIGFGGSAEVQLTFKVEACPSEIRTGHSTNSVDQTPS